MRVLFVMIGTALIAGLSLEGWQLFVGPVPSTNWIAITPTIHFQLPLSLSRWSDVGFAPLWMLLLYCIITRRFAEEEKITVSLALVTGLIVGVAYGITSSTDTSDIRPEIILAHDLTLGLFLSVVAIVFFGLKRDIIFAGVFGFSYGLGKGLIYGLGMGFLFCLTFEVGVFLVFTLIALFKLLFPKRHKTRSF